MGQENARRKQPRTCLVEAEFTAQRQHHWRMIRIVRGEGKTGRASAHERTLVHSNSGRVQITIAAEKGSSASSKFERHRAYTESVVRDARQAYAGEDELHRRRVWANPFGGQAVAMRAAETPI